MAMSKVKIEKDFLKENVDLESVKQLIKEQVAKYGLKNCDTPLCQCPIPNILNNSDWKSDLFVIGNDVYIGQLVLNYNPNASKLTLDLECFRKDGSKKEEETFHSFQHFICKGKFYNSCGSKWEIFTLSKNAFIPDARKNEIHFNLNFDCGRMKEATVEIYLEPSTTSQYVSPSKNAVVGKIEKLKEKRDLVSKNKMLLVSPRFDFGSAGQKMIVSFWHDEPYTWEIDGVWASLHVISEKEVQVGPPFPLKVSFTIFNQRVYGSDFIKKIILTREENKCEYPIFLAFYSDLQLGCLENDTLYYRVVVEPFNFNLSDETTKESK